MSVYTSGQFWKAAAERAVKTGAQTALASIGATALAHEVQWLMVASATGLGVVLSLLTSIASAKISGDGPSLAGETLDQSEHTEPLYLPERAIE